jgi:hypothetical protein
MKNQEIKFEFANNTITVSGDRLQMDVYDYSNELERFCKENALGFLSEPEGETIDGLYQEKINAWEIMNCPTCGMEIREVDKCRSQTIGKYK